MGGWRGGWKEGKIKQINLEVPSISKMNYIKHGAEGALRNGPRPTLASGVGCGEALVSAEEHSAELRGTGHLETLCFRHQAT